ncbi:unnamed protein product [Ambrosiozyma monospora]|uniref:Unnamed protein product n=1 Tax=Ambrosiozyma monospora TaxID=43982 RepID=A0ACB5U2K6_AMBMO|nr:unnamed protein product [Ambrosiozyma monospora]
MADKFDDELIPEEVPGFKVGEKKTLEEYTTLDANDESLNKWKKSLGLSTGNLLPVKPGDKRTVVIINMTLAIDGEEPIVVELDDVETQEDLKNKKIHFKIKEKSIYQLSIKFKVQHEIITGLKYLQAVKKTGITVDKFDEPMGSYAPNTEENPSYERTFDAVEAPSGMLARGSYSAVSKFVDDDKKIHLNLPWTFQITK